MNNKNWKPLFPLGRTVTTPGARELMHRTGVHPFQLLLRHQAGDWGTLDAADCAANDRAVVEGAQILSAYELGENREKMWVISDADRSSTVILLPGEC
ncbi:hypothetical protein CY652_06900 [Burkholderia sp. WAC0059]|uniref:hypothetical protein n=1 Tax=Burkholderia sp. WAC0059 TaxID=2066022 RepID=UPI000C7ED863|nr:hypothetical protein [Burkholderia sp. WAC0059]PLZ03035.1 hypothetical protein CY652_06900 [Burkholderia sp. WAC0059]